MFSHIPVKIYCHGSFKHVELAFPPHASQNSLHQVEILLVLPNILKPSFCHECPPYLPICSIYLPFQVNFYVPNSKSSNEILFCMLEQLMLQLGLPISSMLGGLFSRGVDSAPHSRERAGNWDAQSHDPKRSKQIKIIKQNSPRAVVSWRHSLFRASHGLMLVGGGGV